MHKESPDTFEGENYVILLRLSCPLQEVNSIIPKSAVPLVVWQPTNELFLIQNQCPNASVNARKHLQLLIKTA